MADFQALRNSLPSDRRKALGLVNAQLQRLTVPDLKAVCRGESLAVSGRKSELQSKILRRFNDYLQNDSTDGFDVAFLRIHHPQYQIGYHHLFQPSTSDKLEPDNRNLSTPMSTMAPRQNVATIKFVESPFFRRKAVIANFKLPICQNARHESSGSMMFSASQLEDLRSNSTTRALVYCGEAHSSTPLGTHIKFPQQLEIRVNEQEVKGNFKGVGKKEGSVKPIDITPFIRKQNGPNHFKITYALTSKTYYVVIMLVEKQPVDVLVQHIRSKVITKNQVLAELRSKAADTDIVFESYTMTLKDAASQLRIGLPCRGTNCAHQKCFDATTYLQMQEQAPLWTCPICDKAAPFGNLAIDEYFQEILANTPRSVDSVTIHPDGTWSADTSTASNNTEYDSDDDSDDIVVLPGPRAVSSNVEIATPRSFVQTPNSVNSARGSVAIAPSSSRGQKRQPEIIDLTLSDDDAPASKRPNIGPASHSNLSNGTSSNSLPSLSAVSSISFNLPSSTSLSALSTGMNLINRYPLIQNSVTSNQYMRWGSTPQPQQQQQSQRNNVTPLGSQYGGTWGQPPSSNNNNVGPSSFSSSYPT